MSFDEMIFDEMTFDETIFDEMTASRGSALAPKYTTLENVCGE